MYFGWTFESAENIQIEYFWSSSPGHFVEQRVAAAILIPAIAIGEPEGCPHATPKVNRTNENRRVALALGRAGKIASFVESGMALRKFSPFFGFGKISEQAVDKVQ
ncbi:hypothetical protein [Chromobacterium haemolyticum]|uniref:hypothetical protein n=1 Tax=Chromobacterium haemolyticum TaxID=394935 RepID=UPI0015943595|nr:hypothetical protein [Chromobacterium haemolyticum]